MGRNRSNATAPAVKGDLVTGTGVDTSGVLALGSNGDTLVADSSTSTGLRYNANFAAGKNAVINGDFSVNQRGFSSTTSNATYTFDRWRTDFVGGTVTYSRQSFTPGAAPVVGYESTNFARVIVSGQTNTGGDFALWNQRIENVRTDAGQTVTVSFWAKAASGTPKMSVSLEQNFGSGGSSTVYVYGSAVTISTSWARYSVTIAVPSISGKTIGTSSFLSLNIEASNAYNTNLGFQNGTFDIWGVQLEAGSTATAFQTATGTIQGELAACQRYYWRRSAASDYPSMPFALGQGVTTGLGSMYVQFPVQMRILPFSIDYSGLVLSDHLNANITVTNAVIPTNQGGLLGAIIDASAASGITVYRPYVIRTSSSSGFLGFSAEL